MTTSTITKVTTQVWNDRLLKQRGNYVVTITPEDAERLLVRNVGNRPTKPRAIPMFARDMAAGRWDPDASDIKFDRNGFLADGQNRLIACMRAKAAFTTLVRTGIDPNSKRHVDTGTKRTVADMLKMEGYVGSTSTIAAVVALWVRYSIRVIEYGGKRAIDTKTVHSLTHDEVLDFLDKHPTVSEFASDAEALRRMLPALPVSSILTFLAMAAETSGGPAAARQFAEDMLAGNFGGPGDPMQALVQYAARARALQTGSPGYRGRQGQESHLLALVRVWNAWRTGESIERRITVKINHKLIMPV